MTDPIDRGCEREDELRADAIAEQRRQAVPGVQTCIECQTLIERAGLTVY